MLHATTYVHVEVSFITASSHARTEPQSVIGHTGGKKKLHPECSVQLRLANLAAVSHVFFLVAALRLGPDNKRFFFLQRLHGFRQVVQHVQLHGMLQIGLQGLI